MCAFTLEVVAVVPLQTLSGVRAIALHPAEAGGLFLIASALFLLPFGRAMEIPLTLLALFGLLAIFRKRRSLTARDAVSPRLFFLCFLCYFLPMCLSLPDAVNLPRSMTTTVGSLRYLLAGVGVLYLLGEAPCRPHQQRVFDALEKTLFLVLALWMGVALAAFSACPGASLEYPGRLVLLMDVQSLLARAGAGNHASWKTAACA